jgi:hypothetical protein
MGMTISGGYITEIFMAKVIQKQAMERMKIDRIKCLSQIF